MKITKLTPIQNNEAYDYQAEINLTKKQLEFITNVGLGVLLQAGAMSFMFGDKEENDVTFEEKGTEKEEKTVIEGTSEISTPQPATE